MGIFLVQLVNQTESNILHKTIRRNEHLAKVFYYLKLMEREGSGYDKMYEILLGNGKEIPIPNEGDDRVSVTIKKRKTKFKGRTTLKRIEDHRLRELIYQDGSFRFMVHKIYQHYNFLTKEQQAGVIYFIHCREPEEIKLFKKRIW